MKQTKYFIIDFDSTFTQVEALDVLAEIALKDNENQAKAIQEKPTVIIANTIPGKGVASMASDYKWHGNPPKAEQLRP